MTDLLADRFFAVVVAARVGDAMGTPTENLMPDEIEARLGWVSDFTGDGTDDSLMANLLVDALVDTEGMAGADEWAQQWLRHRDEILSKQDKFFPSVLHAAEKLRYGWTPRHVADGNMPSSSSAMCIWPVGLANAGNPWAAADQAYRLAKLIHVGQVDFCQDAAAAVAAAIAAALRPHANVRDVLDTALAALDPVSGHEMRDLIRRSTSTAGGTTYPTFRDRYHAAFQQAIPCDSRETVPAAFGLAVLFSGDTRTAVEGAANFGRDTDTIATMTGALCAALTGPDSLPRAWLEQLGDDGVAAARTTGEALARVARAKVAAWQRAAASIDGLLTKEAANGR